MSHGDAQSGEATGQRVARIGLCGGPLAALVIAMVPAHLLAPLSPEGQATASVAAWMAIWWMTEAIPLPATSLLPLIMFPLTGVLALDAAAEPYANKFIFLFLGGFMLARAVEKWHLHRRIALMTVLVAGTGPAQLVGGLMLATAGLSMWISNTASTVLMLPIGMSMVRLLDEQFSASETFGAVSKRNFATSLMLGIAYSASIGGLATLVGTPTNLFLAGFAEEQNITIGFGRWMAFALPLSAVLLLATWWLLTYWLYPIRIARIPGGRQLIRDELKKMGRMSRGERFVLAVFIVTALCWVFREPVTQWSWLVHRLPAVGRLDDTLIALIAALILFACPITWRKLEFALDWETAVTIPWGVLLLFGGGFSLAVAIAQSGLAQWIGGQVEGLSALPLLGLMAVVVALVVLLTELTSNTPTAAAFLPILFGVAQSLEVEPLLFLVPATVAATCAFMLPVATPPNAIVFGSGRVTMREMVRAGWWLNVTSIVLIPIWMYLVGQWIFGIE